MSTTKVVDSPDPSRRVGEAIQALGHSQREIAQQVGVSQAFISKVVRCESQPSVALLSGLRRFYGISLDWLLLGEGDMRIQGHATPHAGRESDPLYRLVDQVLECGPRLAGRVEEYLEARIAEHGQQAAARKSA